MRGSGPIHPHPRRPQDRPDPNPQQDGLQPLARAPYFTSIPTATRAMTVGYNPTIDIAIDGAITLRKNGGTTLKPLLHIPALAGRAINITVEQISTTVDDLLTMECAGSAEVTLNDCCAHA